MIRQVLEDDWIPAEVLEHAAGDFNEVSRGFRAVGLCISGSTNQAMDRMAELMEHSGNAAMSDESRLGRSWSLDGHH